MVVGFRATLTTLNLARMAEIPLHVAVINDGCPCGHGIDYGPRRQERLLNVAARNMYPLPDHHGHFVEWLRTRTNFSDLPVADLHKTMVARRAYGD